MFVVSFTIRVQLNDADNECMFHLSCVWEHFHNRLYLPGFFYSKEHCIIRWVLHTQWKNYLCVIFVQINYQATLIHLLLQISIRESLDPDAIDPDVILEPEIQSLICLFFGVFFSQYFSSHLQNLSVLQQLKTLILSKVIFHTWFRDQICKQVVRMYCTNRWVVETFTST